jgi:hypothetical protein
LIQLSCCVGAAQKLITEVQGRFPSSTVMDAFGFVYPQYWLLLEAHENFERHLSVIKEHYGHWKPYDNKTSKRKQPLAPLGDEEKGVPPVLLIDLLDEQTLMFKIAMKGNCHSAMTGDLPLNPLNRLWKWLEASGLLRQKLSEFMKVTELAVVTVLGSVEDERIFSTLSFMKNKLRNRLTTHLPLVVSMHAHQFYDLDDFPYNTHLMLGSCLCGRKTNC